MSDLIFTRGVEHDGYDIAEQPKDAVDEILCPDCRRREPKEEVCLLCQRDRLQREVGRLRTHGSCLLAGPGRGDCEHFVGLPGESIPGQHDGPDDTVDHYGKPNGWCWSCWKLRQIEQMRAELLDRRSDMAEWLCESCNCIHVTQKEGTVLQPCPDCGLAMLPTSRNLREIAHLRARLSHAEGTLCLIAAVPTLARSGQDAEDLRRCKTLAADALKLNQTTAVLAGAVETLKKGTTNA